MRGLLGFTLGLVLVWMIAGMVSEPATAAPTPAAVANYANDGSHSPSTTTGNTPERGPPPYTSSAVTVHDAVDRWSNGASASPDRAIRFGITYDAPAGLGDVARRTHATEGDGQRSDESSCAFERSGVATNKGDDVVRALSATERRTLDDALRPDKLDHVFDPKHNFGPLVQRFGSRENAMEQIVRNIGGPLPASGPFRVARSIGGQTVIIRGAVVDGTPRIGTAFTP